MTTRVLLLIMIVCSTGTTRAVDLRTLPPMNETKMSPDVELKGREVEAIEVALRQFRENRYSKPGDLKHFTVELRREGSKLFVSFFPEMHLPSHRITPAENKYGVYITYAVSLRTLMRGALINRASLVVFATVVLAGDELPDASGESRGIAFS